MASQFLPRVSGIVLAGGKSRRMGRDKAFLEFDGKVLIARVLERIQRVCDQVVIVANDTDPFERFGVPVVHDVFPGKGSLGGIYSGLDVARDEYVLAVACDMPFLNEGLLRYQIALAWQSDVVIPRAPSLSGKTPRTSRGDKPREGTLLPRPDQPLAKEFDLHPMHAVYSKRCLAPMRERLHAGDLRGIGFHDVVRVRVVEPGEIDRYDAKHLSFFNVNTPEDFEFARALIGSNNV